MNRLLKPFLSFFARRTRGAVFFSLLLTSSFGFSATTIGLSSLPLFGARAPHPNVVVSLSVEFPTVSRAYNQDQNNAFIPYVASKTYLGYFDNTKCYSYSNPAPSTTSPSIVQASSEFFYPDGAASTSDHSCASNSGGKFSGNFMNWATMSAVDELRMALTGGNRVVDDAAASSSPKTILLRAFLPDGSIPGVNNFWTTASNNINWPPSTISASASGGSYAGVAPSSVTPISDNTVYTTSCRNLIFFGTSLSGSSCDSPAADRGIYRLAIQVCDANEGPHRTDLCQAYTTASGTIYKPVGQIQKYIDSTRFAVFGYLMDRGASPGGCDDGGWNECRYGGVLRNMMKYVGANNYDALLNATANTRKEINTDGTFITDPDGIAVAQGVNNSGFINYINQFGSTGLYKRRDPVSELFYEALRYLEHQAPTTDATSGMTPPMKDGFPVIDASNGWNVDPVVSRCQANYIINVADANTNDDWFLPGFPGGKTYRPNARPAPDAVGFDAIAATNIVGSFEGRGNLASDTISNGSYLIAGAAYWANVNDMRPDLPGKQTVKTISFDVAEAAGTVNQRQLYLAGKYGGFNDINGDGDPTKTTDANGNTITSNSEWESAPGSGYPSNYFLASSPDRLINGLAAAFATTQRPTGTASGLALSTSNIVYGSAGAYTVSFNPNKWSGSVAFRNLSYNAATGALTVSASAIWDSATQLDNFIGTNPSSIPNNAAARKIYTLDNNGNGTAFDWATVSADTAFSNLNMDPLTGATDGLGQKRLNYLRGDRTTDESPNGQQFRPRGSAFGDIINSAPVYVGGPSSAISDSAYFSFYNTYRNRTPAVYVGANDGMLHAINATTGDELFAYIPRVLGSTLNRLTNPAYTHNTYVDAVPAVAEAKIGSNWKTVLVSGLGAGAQGLFALDVSDPATFNSTFASKVLWEFTDADDPDFGNVLSKPLIIKINTARANVTPVYRWFAVVTGYNNTQADVSSSTDQRGTIFMLALDKAQGASWQVGINYYKIKTPYDSTVADLSKPNGLSPVAYLPNRNGNGDAVALYVGDLQGNLWKIDLTNGGSTTIAPPSSWVGTTPVMYSAKPLFTAKDAAGNRQSITARPALAKGPFNSTMILFGTGQYFGTSDLSTYTQQSFYDIFDDGGTTISTQVTNGRSDLAVRTLTNTNGIITLSGAPVDYVGPSAQKGWYLDFFNTATTGERNISSATIDSGIASFATLTLSSDPCGSGGGYLYQVNAITGLALNSSSIVGAISNVGTPGPPQSVVLSMSSSSSNNTREKVQQIGRGILTSGTSGDIGLTNFSGLGPTKIWLGKERISWREIPNWNGMK